jgi:hypothetical protein
MSAPSPEHQLRERLAAARRGGVPFDRAWDAAFVRGRIHWPHDTTQRRMAKEVIQGTREAWRSAYERTPWPGATGLRILADLPETLNESRDVEFSGAMRGRPVEQLDPKKPSYIRKAS